MTCPRCGHYVLEQQSACLHCGAQLRACDQRIGSMIGGKYFLRRLIAEGGMGRVYAAEQRLGSIVRTVAVKMVQPGLATNEKVVERFMHECGIVTVLRHPNTIEVYDFGEAEGGELYVVMEYVEGRSLAKVLADGGPLAIDRIDHLFAQICGSLTEAHGRGIIHRDLKPDNVLLTSRAGDDDFVKVLDFGIAWRADPAAGPRERRLTEQGTVLGTPAYMAPERFSSGPVDATSDVYALGVMAYECATGILPFVAETMFEWAARHTTADPLPFDSTEAGAKVPERMRRAILRALAKRPRDRPQSARAFLEELTHAFPQRDATAPQVILPPLPVAATVNEPRSRVTKTKAATPARGFADWRADVAIAKGQSAPPVQFPTPAPLPSFEPKKRSPTIAIVAGAVVAMGAAATLWAVTHNRGDRDDMTRKPRDVPAARPESAATVTASVPKQPTGAAPTTTAPPTPSAKATATAAKPPHIPTAEPSTWHLVPIPSVTASHVESAGAPPPIESVAPSASASVAPSASAAASAQPKASAAPSNGAPNASASGSAKP
ncbi:MAG: protein kinase [Polyangiaceae bacterium]|nr:protein kinase [Polyangiaceae bacterium]